METGVELVETSVLLRISQESDLGRAFIASWRHRAQVLSTQQSAQEAPPCSPIRQGVNQQDRHTPNHPDYYVGHHTPPLKVVVPFGSTAPPINH